MTHTQSQSPRITQRRGRLLLAVGLAASTALLAGTVDAGAQEAVHASTAATVTNSAVTEYATPTPFAAPGGTALGPDGRIWFTEYLGQNIGAITPGGVISEYHLPAGIEPVNITPIAADGQHGALMFFTALGDQGTIGVDGSAPNSWSTLGGGEIGTATGLDGTTVWTAEASRYDLDTPGRIVKDTGYGPLEYFDISTPDGVEASPTAVAVAPDGTIWFTDIHDTSEGYIGKLTTDGIITEYPIGLGHANVVELFSGLSYAIATGPDGNMWFTLPFSRSIGRITPAGVITLFDTGAIRPFGITTGVDGNLWFTTSPCDFFGVPCSDTQSFYAGSKAAKLGRITPTGDITSYPLPTPTGGGWGISTGADGNLWFTETDASKIGTMSTSPMPPPAPTAASGASSALVSVRANADGPAPTTYVVTASPGGKTCTIAGAAGSCTVRGLANGKSYTFTTIGANTSPRPSAVSAASAPVKVGYFSLRLNSATGTTITTTFNAPGIGWAYQHGYTTQQGRTSATHQISICAMSKKVRKAGKTKLTCTLTKAARTARKRGTLVVSMVTTFVATGKAPVASTTTLTLRHH